MSRGIEILIQALYQGSGVKQAESDLQRLERQASQSAARVDAQMAKILQTQRASVDKSEAQRNLGRMSPAEQQQFLDQYERQQSSASSLMADFSALRMQVLAAGAAIGGVIAAAKGLYEFGQAGAQIDQVNKGFLALQYNAQVTPDLLLKMRVASQGTISDYSLMANASTLLAGSSGELQHELGLAAPRLVEIARAASILSPSVKDVDDAFERLAIGIRRNSPKRIDDLGIQLKLGNAYEDFAKKIGVSTDALTKEQQAMAILNAVLEQGDALIEQSKGAISGAQTSFQQFQAVNQNTWDTFRKNASPAIAQLFGWLVRGETQLQENTSRIFEDGQAAIRAGKSYEDYTAAVQASAKARGMYIDQAGRLMQVNELTGAGRLVQESFMLGPEDYLKAQGKTYGPPAPVAISDKVPATAGQYYRAMGAQDVTKFQQKEAAEARRLANVQELVAASVNGKLGPAYEQYIKQTKELSTQQAELQKRYDQLVRAGYSPQSKYMRDMKKDIDDLGGQQDQLTGNIKQSTASLIYNGAAAGLNADAQLELARQMGLVDETTYAVVKAQQDLKAKYDANKDGIISGNENIGEYVSKVADLNRYIQMLEDKHVTITLDILQNGEIVGGGSVEATRGSKNQEDRQVGAARGLHMVVPPGYPNDSYTIGVQSGETVDVAPAGASPRRAGGVVIQNQRVYITPRGREDSYSAWLKRMSK